MAPPRNVSQKGVDFIKSFEGLVDRAYKDSAGVWTIGYGHTTAAGPPTVLPSMTLEPGEADDILKADLSKFVALVNKLVTVEISQNQFDALVSFDFNTGALASSTLLKLINAKRLNEVPAQFLLWDHAGGKKVPGLTRRRVAEVAMWCEVDSAPPSVPPRAIPVEQAPAPSIWSRLAAWLP